MGQSGYGRTGLSRVLSCGRRTASTAYSRVTEKARLDSLREIAWQHCQGRSLLLQCLAGLSQKPRILHRDNRLRREILQERDFFLGKGADFCRIAKVIDALRSIS